MGERENLAIARGYLRAIESGADFAEVEKFLSSEIVLETLPNLLLPKGNRDNLEGMRAASVRGRKVMARQTYEVSNELASGDQVALEVNWAGTLAVPYETIPAGAQMRARFAMFLRFKNGKIVEQHNYDCFEPW